MLKSTGNFGNEGTLNLFQRLGDQRVLKCLLEAIWQRLHLLIKLLTKIDIQVQFLQLIGIMHYAVTCCIYLINNIYGVSFNSRLLEYKIHEILTIKSVLRALVLYLLS